MSVAFDNHNKKYLVFVSVQKKEKKKEIKLGGFNTEEEARKVNTLFFERLDKIRKENHFDYMENKKEYRKRFANLLNEFRKEYMTRKHKIYTEEEV